MSIGPFRTNYSENLNNFQFNIFHSKLKHFHSIPMLHLKTDITTTSPRGQWVNYCWHVLIPGLSHHIMIDRSRLQQPFHIGHKSHVVEPRLFLSIYLNLGYDYHWFMLWFGMKYSETLAIFLCNNHKTLHNSPVRTKVWRAICEFIVQTILHLS